MISFSGQRFNSKWMIQIHYKQQIQINNTMMIEHCNGVNVKSPIVDSSVTCRDLIQFYIFPFALSIHHLCWWESIGSASIIFLVVRSLGQFFSIFTVTGKVFPWWYIYPCLCSELVSCPLLKSSKYSYLQTVTHLASVFSSTFIT